MTARVTPSREELAAIIDPDAFEDAMLQDDLTPSERLHFSQSRERDKIAALNKADAIIAHLAAKPADEGAKEALQKIVDTTISLGSSERASGRYMHSIWKIANDALSDPGAPKP